MWCEAFVNGTLSHVMQIKWLRAPSKEAAQAGAEQMMLLDYPKGADFQALVSQVPAQGMETGTAKTEGLGAKHDSPVAESDAPNPHPDSREVGDEAG